jgi:hypothetical protein
VIAIISESSDNNGLGIFVLLDEVFYGDLNLLDMLFAENKDISLSKKKKPKFSVGSKNKCYKIKKDEHRLVLEGGS